MGTLTGGHLIVKSLKREGVKRIFGLCGDHINPIFNACLDYGVEVIDTRHESAAVHMADAWARVTGEPGVAVVTGGPGHTNAMTGLATAYLAGSPVILISGQFNQYLKEKNALQEMDQMGMSKPVTKWVREVTEVKRIPEYIAAAYREAVSGRPGPVNLNIPVDVATAEVEESSISFPARERYRILQGSSADPDLIEKAVALLKTAERPVCIAGSGVWWAQASLELQKFIELTQIPLFTIGMARGIVSDFHPLCFGYADTAFNPVAKEIKQADVVLVLGKRIDFRLKYGGPGFFDPKAKLIQVDTYPGELGKNRELEIGILADAKSTLKQLITTAEEKKGWGRKAWIEYLRKVAQDGKEQFAPYENSDEIPIHPLRLCREVKKMLDEDTTLVFDGGDFVHWCRLALSAHKPGHWLRLGPLAAIGASIPFAIATKLARPDKQVVVLTGDGAFAFFGWEFHTAIRHKLPIVVVIGNDRGWGLERELQKAIYGKDRVIGCDLGMVRYDKVVEALGGHGEFVEKPEQLQPALERAFKSGLPACVNVMIAESVSPFTKGQIEAHLKHSK
ncbi:MAG TPA: thiamine pyrophosphate-binding protein [Candidatus Limnocylindrales bacterium]|nr:thiamine pyrophosphate-binding protein [Candidatus Limnocylindrales bacterium]